MAKKEGDPILENLESSPEEEEITLSDSELDSVLGSAEITSESAEDALEQYGVWVKAGPQDIGASGEADLDFELADLDAGHGAEADLTEEEEKLLGELEGDSEIGEGLSVLEDDLEELGKSAAGPEGIGVDIEELGTGAPGGETLELEEMPEEFPDLEAETLEGLDSIDAAQAPAADFGREGEIEVPLSDRAAVEEHYEDLAPLEGVPSTPGMSPPNILERIEKDLNQIKAEIQSLKNELAGFAGGGSRKADVKPAQVAAASFEKGDDDTIALTGDELDNILNTADITEEPAEPAEEGLDELDSLEAAEEVDLEAPPPGRPAPRSAKSSPPALDLESDEEAASELSLAEDVLEPGSLDLSEEPLEAIEAAPEEALTELEAGDELGEIELLEDAAPAEGAAELSLEESGGPPALEELETLEELEIPELEAEAAPSRPAGPDLQSVEPELAAEELSLEAPDGGLDGTLEDLDLVEEPPAQPPTAAESQEALGSLESIPEIELAAEELPTQSRPAAQASQAGIGGLSKELQSDIRSVLSYLDQLLEALPNEKIQEFAQSQYFGIYKRLFDELGLGA